MTVVTLPSYTKQVWYVDFLTPCSIVHFIYEKKKGEGISQKTIRSWIDSGYCFIKTTQVLLSSQMVKYGDEVILLFPAYETLNIEKTILYEDDDIILWNKPPYIECEQQTVAKLFQQISRDVILVHRLDKSTSGVLLLAKKDEIYHNLVKQFQEKKVQKEYLAIVDREVTERVKSIKKAIGPLTAQHGKPIWSSHAREKKDAWTDWVCLKKTKTASLLQLTIHTGRTHQIRVHVSEEGHPIIGDTRYGKKFTCPLLVVRPLLHAERIIFYHPRTKKMCEYRAEIPNDFQEALHILFSKGD